VTNKIFGSFRHAVHGFVDVDPERTRRDQIGKTKESLVQLEQALEVSEKDVKDASAGVLKDLKRFQKEKEDDFQRYMVSSLQLTHLQKLTLYRSPMPDVTLIGRRRIWKLGKRHNRTPLIFIHNEQLGKPRGEGIGRRSQYYPGRYHVLPPGSTFHCTRRYATLRGPPVFQLKVIEQAFPVLANAMTIFIKKVCP
jgi:hypothetical protein